LKRVYTGFLTKSGFSVAFLSKTLPIKNALGFKEGMTLSISPITSGL
jgi:hypothetical protein